jgi:hypothetical protein
MPVDFDDNPPGVPSQELRDYFLMDDNLAEDLSEELHCYFPNKDYNPDSVDNDHS